MAGWTYTSEIYIRVILPETYFQTFHKQNLVILFHMDLYNHIFISVLNYSVTQQLADQELEIMPASHVNHSAGHLDTF